MKTSLRKTGHALLLSGAMILLGGYGIAETSAETTTETTTKRMLPDDAHPRVVRTETTGTVTRADGSTHEFKSQGHARAHRQEDGSVRRHAVVNRQGPRGEVKAVHDSIIQKVDENTRSVGGTIRRTGPNGYQADVKREGSITRDGKTSTYEGTSTGTDNRGHQWQAEHRRVVTRNGDGTATFESTHQITRDNGRSHTIERSGTITRDREKGQVNREVKANRSGDGARGKADRPARSGKR